MKASPRQLMNLRRNCCGKIDRRVETKTINSWELAHNRLHILISIGRTPENEISCRAIQKKGNESFTPTTYEFTAELLRKN